ncbi:hypothetical protein [Neomoorella humiferrea]|uniref:Uncharacterized protein n=1 Tax=Neomoorella humiferrea TaxID=676965 RepID=A0A2T0AR20_9FIRM|nr:hypothetical protein [Moorella humiferrea]PRR71964.1 hypothetical protein MOHU_15960 [Moorella humiferrea]
MNALKKRSIYVVAITIILGLVILITRYPHWFLENGTLLLGWILFLFNWLYYHVDQIYWLVQKGKYTIINPDTTWDLSIRYSVKKIDPITISTLQKHITKAAILDRAIIRTLSLNRFEVKADELNIEIYFDMDNSTIEVLFSKIPVSFRGSQRTIEERILPIIENLENDLAVITKKYWLTVYFGELNPYFGLYMRRLHQKNISEMHVKINDNNKGTLELSKQKLTIMTETLNTLNEKARKYLTLSEMPV